MLRKGARRSKRVLPHVWSFPSFRFLSPDFAQVASEPFLVPRAALWCGLLGTLSREATARIHPAAAGPG